MALAEHVFTRRRTSLMTYNFNIAEHDISIVFEDATPIDGSLIQSLEPFKIESEPVNPLLKLIVTNDLKPYSPEDTELIRDIDTGNGMTLVDVLPSGGYQFHIRNLQDKLCCLLHTNKDFSLCYCKLEGNFSMRNFGINNALMLAYAFAGSFKQTLLIHASLVRHENRGYAFTAKSGTGKSTHVSLWLRYIPNCDLMNDDNPIIRIIDGRPYIYGSPWSGKTPCYRNIKAELGAISRIDRAKVNSVERLKPIEAFASLLPSCSTMKWDKDVFNNACNTITKIIETTGIYITHCLPDKDAALLCRQTIAK
jgi:hypothetical protein